MNFGTKTIALHELESYVLELRDSLSRMHKQVADDRSAIRARSRANWNKHNRKCPNFNLGDFVLMAEVFKKISSDKLRCMWQGPMVITKIINDWVYVVSYLSETQKHTVHAQRLKFYSDSSLPNLIKSITSWIFVHPHLVMIFWSNGLVFLGKNKPGNQFKYCTKMFRIYSVIFFFLRRDKTYGIS